MKILLATGISFPEIGGPATYAKQFVAEFSRRGHQVTVLSYGEGKDGVSRKIPKGIRHLIFFVRCFARAWSSDVVFCQDLVGAGIPAMLVSKILRKPFIVRVPGDYAWEISVQKFGVKEGIDDFQKKSYGWRVEMLRWLEQRTVRNANAVICPSVYFRNLVGGWGVAPHRLNAIYNGIDFPKEPLPSVPYADRQRVIISAGRLVPWKGFDVLIRLLKDLPGWTLQIAGDGPDADRLIGVASECGVTDRVVFLGRIERTEVLSRLAQARIFLLNSGFESFSFQVVEAMYAGSLVVVADIGNLSEIVHEQKNGYLIPLNDLSAMRDLIRRVDADPAGCENVIAQSKQDAQQYSVARTIDAVEALCQKLLSRV